MAEQKLPPEQIVALKEKLGFGAPAIELLGAVTTEMAINHVDDTNPDGSFMAAESLARAVSTQAVAYAFEFRLAANHPDSQWPLNVPAPEVFQAALAEVELNAVERAEAARG